MATKPNARRKMLSKLPSSTDDTSFYNPSPIKPLNRNLSDRKLRVRPTVSKSRPAAMEQKDDAHQMLSPPSEATLQLRRELQEVMVSIAAEKRAKAKLKSLCEAGYKNLISAQKERETLQNKIEAAQQIIASCDAQSRESLQAEISNIDSETARIAAELRESELQLSAQHQAAHQSHQKKLQRQVDSIRTADDNKKLNMWRKKVLEAESNVKTLEAETEKLKQHASGGRASPHSNHVTVAHEADLELQRQKEEYAQQLTKLQDDIHREAKQAQFAATSTIAEITKKNHTLALEVAHLEQQRQSKGAELAALQREVDKLNRSMETNRKRREAIDLERQQLDSNTESVIEATQALQSKAQETSAQLNQLMLMSSNAPMMHEKAWTQEKASMQSTLNSTTSKTKQLEADLKAMIAKVESLKSDVQTEHALCDQEAELLKKLERFRAALQAVTQQQVVSVGDDTGSQKENIIRDLEAAVKLERRHADEVKSYNERLEKKFQEAKQLLHAHGFDV